MAQYTTEGGRGDIERAKGCGNGANLFVVISVSRKRSESVLHARFSDGVSE